MSDQTYTHDDLRAISKEQGLGLRISDNEDIDSVIDRVYEAQQAKGVADKKATPVVNDNYPSGKTPPPAPSCYGNYKPKATKCHCCWYSKGCK